MRMQNDDKKEIKKALKSVYERFGEMIAENEELRAENARLRSIRYKDEELARIKKEVETGNKMLANGFSVSDKENKMADEWIDQHIKGNRKKWLKIANAK